jgi:hypothetical protein
MQFLLIDASVAVAAFIAYRSVVLLKERRAAAVALRSRASPRARERDSHR